MKKNDKTTALCAQVSKFVEGYADVGLPSQPLVFGTKIVSLSGKFIDESELKNIEKASLFGWMTSVRFNFQFERKLATFFVIKHLIAPTKAKLELDFCLMES